MRFVVEPTWLRSSQPDTRTDRDKIDFANSLCSYAWFPWRRPVIDEEDVPAEQPATEAHARLPFSDGYPRRPEHTQAAEEKGAKAPDREHPAKAAGMTASYRYPKTARVRRRAEFVSLQRDGGRRHTAHLIVIRRPAHNERTRLGVTVSKRIGNAVVRNRVKRLLREAFRHRQIEIQPPLDVVVIAKPGAENLTYAQAATEFARGLGLET